MSGDSEPQPAITIEETYAYDIDVGAQVLITPLSSSGTIHVTVPYDGRLIDPATAEADLSLGRLRLINGASDTNAATIPLTMPLGGAAVDAFKNGEEAVWDFSYTPPPVRDNLIGLEADMFAGAAFDPTESSKELVQLLFQRADTFVNDLQLRLSLWVPELKTTFQPGRRGHELRTMLSEQESAVQIFVPDPSRETELCESMAALANSDGGRILIGVRPPGEVLGIDKVPLAELEVNLLQASLRCSPPVAFSPPELFLSEDGYMVARVTISPGRRGPHAVGTIVPIRRGATTLRNVGVPAAAPRTSVQPIGDWRALLSAGPTERVMMLDAKGVDISALELGPAICGLINGAAGGGLLVIRNLVPQRRGFLGLSNARSAMQEVEQRLRAELADCSPTLMLPAPEFAPIDDERIAVIRVRAENPVVAIYKGRGYEWTGAALRAVELGELYDRYMNRSGQQLVRRSGAALIALKYAELRWPVQPPPVAKLVVDTAESEVSEVYAGYDYQRRAMIWQNKAFREKQGTNGYICELTTHLRQAFTELDIGVEANPDKTIEGVFRIRLDNTLASGVECMFVEEHRPRPLLQAVPVYKHTQIIVNVRVRANELFLRRRRTALLHFQIPDVSLSSELSDRVDDLQQICADMGFWVARPDTFLPDGARGVLLRGVRSTNFQDVDMVLGMLYRTAELTRQLRFKQRVDSKQIQTGHLDARIVLSGTGDNVGEEMARLLLDLGRLIHERLHYLRTE